MNTHVFRLGVVLYKSSKTIVECIKINIIFTLFTYDLKYGTYVHYLVKKFLMIVRIHYIYFLFYFKDHVLFQK